ncbi:hypothetical protein KVG88_30310 [Pseudomonas sp. SWRI74]|uniref:LytTR family transcriptional regulator n=1 Tax=Pseudomonas azerbaijanoccidentalis TaxID=2842347 RepID=A0ABS6QZK5_9PSED|nr:hypothetical protein [Pseudomonas azerbaijanoccidentalis]MBV4524370.1 hypothetical protein [Pseudomonas azerbaijanoccidentalis]
MELRRYRKNHRLRAEKVDSSVFVAFWADDKYVHALDRDGVEWMLCGKHSIKEIEAGDPRVTRAHRSSLVRVSAIDRVMSRNELRKNKPDYFCVVGGREFGVSRTCRPTLYAQYRAYVAEHGFVPAVAA